jgi:hypothetical protein
MIGQALYRNNIYYACLIRMLVVAYFPKLPLTTLGVGNKVAATTDPKNGRQLVQADTAKQPTFLLDKHNKYYPLAKSAFVASADKSASPSIDTKSALTVGLVLMIK